MRMQSRGADGFTLVELVVVIVLISIMLTFSIPRLRQDLFADGFRQASQWIILSVPELKDRAVREQNDYRLNVDIHTDRLWITSDAMSAEEAEAAAAAGYKLPADVNILDVEYPDIGRLTAGQAFIHFYKKGYSDKALIHIEDQDNKQRSLLIEPFLNRVRLFERYISFGS